MQPTTATAATTAAVATALALFYLVHKLLGSEPEEEEAYCVPCGNECPPAQRQRTHQLIRQSSVGQPTLGRHRSIVDDGLLSWAAYAAAPTSLFGSEGINAAGVQRIDLPYVPWALETVAAFLDDEEQSGLGALRPLHRLNTPERLAAWKERFDSMDLGSYDELSSHAKRLSPEAIQQASDFTPPGVKHFATLRWSILVIEPNRFFPCHAHPNNEIIYCARGALYENRVLPSAINNSQEALDSRRLSDSGFPKLFRVHKRQGGEAFDNPRYSVHQSYTLDEGCVLLVLWCGRHANYADPDNLLWDVPRCQNPLCPLACPDKTFQGLARNSGKRTVAEV